MQKLIRKYIFIIVALLLTIPAFWRMLGYGMFSTQDFHIFRQIEFDKCVKILQIPCRWSPDAGLGYGEPLFNFYGQFTYSVGEIYHLLGGSFINSVKFLFVLSLALSSLSMFLFTWEIWKDRWAALVSSILYVYAPYRAVDVWVRGALPEAFSFIFFPLILLAIEKKSVRWFSLLIAILIISHNLSFIMFIPLLLVWLVYRRFWKGLWGFGFAGLFTSFYVLPVVFESKFIDLESTISGYFDFHNHFATLNELFISNFWGYGASVWGPVKGLSLSVGYLQWSLPILVLLFIFLRKELFQNKSFLIFLIMGWFYLFLTHNKSTFFWEHISFMRYIQFPWRFLGMIVFCFAMCSGFLLKLVIKGKMWLGILIISLAIGYNSQFFRPDLWYKVGDNYYMTGSEWIRQRSASIGDFWPNFGHRIPTTPSNGSYINYFPGWNYLPDMNGLIPARGAIFSDTLVRKIGNTISLISLLGFGLILIYNNKS